MITTENLTATKPYPREILELATTAGFIAEFYQQCQHHKTDVDAFEYLNDLHEKFFGKPKYSDWESFKTIRKRYVKQIRERK